MQKAHDWAIVGFRRYDRVRYETSAGSEDFFALKKRFMAANEVEAAGIVRAPHRRQSALAYALRQSAQLLAIAVPSDERHRIDVTLEKPGNGQVGRSKQPQDRAKISIPPRLPQLRASKVFRERRHRKTPVPKLRPNSGLNDAGLVRLYRRIKHPRRELLGGLQ
jgi:hypothetical protein